MKLGLENSRVIVTGATSGLGRAIATGFIAEGAKVFACGMSPNHPMPEGACGTICADLTQADAADAVIEAAVAKLGGLDTLIAAAGGSISGTLADSSDKSWEEGLELNLLGVIRIIRSSIPYVRQTHGRIVIIGALSGNEPRPNHVISNVSKSGIRALAKTLSRELAVDSVLVNCLAPGRIRTAQLDRAFPSDSDRTKFSNENIPLGRFGDADEIVPITLLLSSPLNTYITGQTIGVDGGMAWSL